MAKDAIIFSAAPGVGKTTVALGLRSQFGWPYLELGRIRMTYLDPQWKTENPREAQMSFEILCHMIHRFADYGLKHTMALDLFPEHLTQIPSRLTGLDYLIISLGVKDKQVHRSRLLNPARDSGYRDLERAWAWNNSILSRELLPHEIVVDTTDDTVPETVERVRQIIESQDGPVGMQGTPL